MPFYQFDIHVDIVSDEPMTSITEHREGDSAARSLAGRLAKRNACPVDLLRGGSEPHNERYIITAMPSEYHAAGFRFERLDG
jgi:hypothetical protein